MKNVRTSVALLAVLAVCGCATRLGGGSASTARINSVEGQAEISRQSGDWAPARLWQTLRPGDRARTGGNGKIDFHLGRFGGVLTLMPASVVEFEQLGPSSPGGKVAAVIHLIEGRVVGDTLKLPPDTRIQIRTRGGVHEIP